MAWLLHDPLIRFIAQFVVIITTARLLGRVARRIGQPLVIAEIVAGIALGPSLLGWAAPAVSATVFPAGSLEGIRLTSQLGLVLFVFLIGLELDHTWLRGKLRASIAISIACVAVPFGSGALLALWLERFFDQPAPTGAFAVFLGAAMSITAFPVLARLLAEHRLLRTRLGSLAITCAAINDAVAWCMLAFVVALARADGVGDAFATTGMSLAFVALMLLIVRPILRRIAAARESAPVLVSHDLVAALLIGTLLSAAITHLIGIHLLFGAFLFGAVVPKHGGFARALAEKLEDIVMVVFMPLLFAISGLRTQIDLFVSAEHLVPCAVVVFVACASKLGAGALAARLGGLPWRDATALGVLMNTRGLMELVVINIGLEMGLISTAVFSMMVIMVLVTTIVTSPLLRRIYPAAEAMRELVAAEPTPPARHGFRVLTCISHRDAGASLVGVASVVAESDAELIALHLAALGPGHADAEAVDMAEVLAPALEHADALGVATRPLAFPSVDAADDIVRVADVRDVDLVLLGLHKPVVGGGPLGGVVREVLRRAETTVAVYVDRGMPLPPARIIVPLVGSVDDRAAVDLAARAQRGTGAEVVVIAPSAKQAASHVARVQEGGGRVSVRTVQHDRPLEAVVEQAQPADLVVVAVGTGGRGKRHSESVMERCVSSMLVVRGRSSALAAARVAER